MKPYRMISQSAQILAWLRRGRALTPMTALHEFGCLRLGARIYDLRRRGHKIVTTWQQTDRKRFARYRML